MCDPFPLVAQCKAITNDFKSHPLAAHFINPFANDKKLLNDYQAKIKNFKPMDLSLVWKRLKENYYQSVHEWSNDMHLIFQNSIDYYGEKDVFGGVAVYMTRKLDKKIRALQCKNLRNYENELIELAKELEAIIRKPPPAYNIECNYATSTEDGNNFTVERINRLKEKLEQMITSGKEDDIRQVLNETEPDRHGLEVDLGHLGRRTLLALEALVANL